MYKLYLCAIKNLKIFGLRKEYPAICRDKDLTIGDPKHVELPGLVNWNEDNPIIHHIHGRSAGEHGTKWEELFRGPVSADRIPDGKLFGTKIRCEITFE